MKIDKFSVKTALLLFGCYCILQSSVSDALSTTTRKAQAYPQPSSSSFRYEDSFHVKLNEFFKAPVPAPFKKGFSIFEETKDDKLDTDDFVTLLTAAPGSPAVPKPLYMVLMASLPTGLLWYGYYKFVVEEELLQMELESGKEPRGFGGYGTLGPFTYGILLGPMASLLHVPGGNYWSALGVIFIYYTQFLLYDRVNRLYQEDEDYTKSFSSESALDSNDNPGSKPPAPLQVWWCLPIFFPFNLIVGLRQVHFLSQYCYKQRGVSMADPLADFFPFIKKSSLTWQELVTTPSLWCSAFSEVEAFDPSGLPEPMRRILTYKATYE